MQVMPLPSVALLTEYITTTLKKTYHNPVLQHPNSGTFGRNALQRIIHFYVIIHLKRKQIAKHDRNENHVKETKGMYSVSSNKIRSEPKGRRMTYLCSE